MKHLKTYKLFEADIKRTFGEWLENPKAQSTSDFYTYNFEFPVKKVFNIDESNLDIDKLSNYLLKEKGCNLAQEIANEIDLSSGFEEENNIDVSEQEVKSNFSEYFDTWIEQQYDGDMSKFFRMYDLDFEDSSISTEDFENIKNDFNENDLSQHYTYREYGHDFKIESILITNLTEPNIINGEIIVNRPLSEDELDSVKDYFIGQLSDGWGESVEQSQEKEEIDGIEFYVSIKTWWGEGYPEWEMTITQ